MASIYFFWDSKTFGFLVLLLSLVSYLTGLYKIRKLQSKSTLWVRLGIGFFALLLIGIPIMLAVMMNSDAYKAAISQLKSNPDIQKETGIIKGHGLLTSGNISTSTLNGVTSEEAQFSFTINGEKKYVDVTVSLIKEPGAGWQIVSIN